MTTNNLTDTIRRAEEEFEEEFIKNKADGFKSSAWMDEYNDIKSHIKSTHIDLLKAVEEWANEKIRPNAYLEDGTLQERDNYFYNLALRDLLSLLRQAREELEGNK